MIRPIKNDVEVVKDFDKFQVIKLFADTLYTNNDKENGTPYYGDIYEVREGVLKEHPNAEVLEGYGVINKTTGYIDEDSEDWYYTLEDALEFIQLNQ